MAGKINRDIVTYLRILVSEKHNAWVSKIQSFKNTINTTYHTTIKMTTVEAMRRHAPTRPWDEVFSNKVEQSINKEESNKLIKN